MLHKNVVKSYCLFVRSGSEGEVVSSINKGMDGIRALAPKRSMQEKRSGKWIQRNLPLLPGYVFVYELNERKEFDKKYISGKNKISNAKIRKNENIYKLLNYEDGGFELQGGDRDYALWLYRNHGLISSSMILEDGDGIRVLEGPLKDCKGRIVRLDRHKRRAVVEFDFDGSCRRVNLAADIISMYEELAQDLRLG